MYTSGFTIFAKKLHHKCSTGLYIGLWKYWNFQREAKLEQIIAIVTTHCVFLLKFKTVSEEAFTYSNSTIKTQGLRLNVWKLLQILINTPCNTSFVEWGYSLLYMVCDSRRSHLKTESLETLLLLTTLNCQ